MRLHLRTFNAVTALVAAALIAGCSSVATVSRPAQSASGHPAAPTGPDLPSLGQSGVVTVNCTNSVSDAVTLQRAIDSSAVGSLIEIKGPVCLLVRGITFLSDRTYTGYNTTGTILKQDGAMNYVLASQAYTNNSAYTDDPVTIRDFTIQCNSSGNTDGIIVLNWQADVEGVDVEDCGGSGIVDTNTTANGHAINNTSVNSRFDNNFISDAHGYGFEVQDSDNSVTDGFFDNNEVAQSGLDAIHLENAAGWNITGNNLYLDSQNGIYADRLFRTTISDNHVEDFGVTQTSGTWYGIVGTVQGGGVGSTISSNNISNDMTEGRNARFIYFCITRTNYGTGYLSVTGNVIVGVRNSDVGLSFTGEPNKLVIASSGNEVTNVGTPKRDAPSVTDTAGV